MADGTIDSFPAVTTLADTDVLAIINGGLDKQVTLTQLTTYFEQRGRQHNAAVVAQTPAANTDTYITNSDVAITQSSVPANRIQAKSKYRLDMAITKSTAGTGTPTFNVRTGTAGAIGDTSRLLFTWPAANTAVADEMHVTITVTWRTVGSGTTAVLEGELKAEHELTTTGFGGTGLTNIIILNVTSGGFDSTTAGLKIGCSVNGGTGSAWTIRQAQAILENLA